MKMKSRGLSHENNSMLLCIEYLSPITGRGYNRNYLNPPEQLLPASPSGR